MRKALILLPLAMMTGGCVSTVWDVATAPVRAGAQVVDWTTTSQSESDRNYGRKMREKEAREGRELKERERERRKEEARRARERDD